MTGSRLVLINAGGRRFQTAMHTLRQYPNTKFYELFSSASTAAGRPPPPCASSDGCVSSSSEPEVFLDVCPKVFERVLNFLRTKRLRLPTEDLSLRGDLIHQLRDWGLLQYAVPSHADTRLPTLQGDDEVAEEGEGASSIIPLPEVCVVQLLDTMSLEAGVRRHALTVTYGADGFQLRPLTIAIRKDLRYQLSSTYWQVHQTGERSLFFATTRVADGAAALLTTSVQQQVVMHTEALGYTLVSSNVTISPDPVHASVRLFLQQLIFRRARLSLLEPADAPDVSEDEDDREALEETFANNEPRHVGPQRRRTASTTDWLPPEEERSEDLWVRKD